MTGFDYNCPHIKSAIRTLLCGVADTRTTISNKEIFDTIMSNVHGAMKSKEGRDAPFRQDKEFLLRIIRVLARPLQDALVARLWLSKGSLAGAPEAEIDLDDLWFPYDTKLQEKGDGIYSSCLKKCDGSYVFRLGLDPVLPWPWEKGRLWRSMSMIGEGRPWGKWKHKSQTIIGINPLNLAIMGSGGNHSIATGIAMCEGQIEANYFYDFTDVYPLVGCDGRHYFKKIDNSVLSDVVNPVFAAIFEIGRLVYNIDNHADDI